MDAPDDCDSVWKRYEKWNACIAELLLMFTYVIYENECGFRKITLQLLI
jgi:hypothetical protein